MARVRIKAQATFTQQPATPFAGILQSRVRGIDVSADVSRWTEIAGTLGAAAEQELNLAAAAAPGGGTHAFASVKHIVVDVSAGQVTLAPSDTNGFAGLGAGVVVTGRHYLTFAGDGLPVGGSTRVLDIIAGAAGATFRIAIAGDAPA